MAGNYPTTFKRRPQVPSEEERLYEEFIHTRYSLERNKHLKAPTSTDNLRIVVIGKTGVGKSATANAILGYKRFKEDFTTDSVTTRSARCTRIIFGRTVSVIDTPGLYDSSRSQDHTLEEVARVVRIFRQGIHAFVYVLNLASPRFTDDDKRTLGTLEMMFGGEMKDYRLLVYTHAESHLGPEMDLDGFCKKQKTCKTSTSMLLREQDDNIVAINNKSKCKYELRRNQKVLLAMIDKIREDNRNAVYTNDMFEAASAMRENISVRLSKIGVSMTLSETMEQILDEQPELMDNLQLLKQKVREKMEDDLKQLEDALFNNKMQDVKSEVRNMHENTEENNRKRKRINEEREFQNEIEDREQLLSNDNLDKAVAEVGNAHSSYISSFFSFVKGKWLSR